MKKIKLIFTILVLSALIAACQTIKEKTDTIVKKENEKLSKFIGKSSSDLQIGLGKPEENFKNSKGNLIFVYNSKKYGIPCERRFEINADLKVIGFVSNGCF
ncbi:hypothetical protein OAN68_03155 [Candidatus Pelagibacter sp.]|nr:hypothetical protein [Candidatus Pelagibacter sp.]